jgi:hypothetical protein
MTCPSGWKRTSGRLVAGFVVLVLLTAAFPAFSQEEGGAVVIDAQGVALIRGEDQAKARDSAVQEALRKAVRQVLLTMLRVDDPARLPRGVDRILSRPERYVDTFSVLEEGPRGNVYEVQLRAAVLSAFLFQDLERMGVRREGAANAPRTHVSVRVQGVYGFDGFIRMRTELSGISGIRQVLPRQVAPGEVWLDVDSTEPLARLSEQIAASGFFVIQQAQETPGRLEIEFRP